MTDTSYSIELTARELRLVESALRSFRSDFGHDESDVLDEVKGLLAKLTSSVVHAQTDPAEAGIA